MVNRVSTDEKKGQLLIKIIKICFWNSEPRGINLRVYHLHREKKIEHIVYIGPNEGGGGRTVNFAKCHEEGGGCTVNLPIVFVHFSLCI